MTQVSPHEGQSGSHPVGQSVVMTQPGHSTVSTIGQHQAQESRNSQPGTWRTGLFDCFEDLPLCLYAAWCGLCLECKVANDMGESPCVPCCVPGSLVVLRTKRRLQHNINGSVLRDCFDATCCGYCVLCQLAREGR